MNEPPPFHVDVFRDVSRERCLEQALVLRAVQIPFQILQGPHGFHLTVPRDLAESALAELANYREENAQWPPKYDSPPLRQGGKGAALLYAFVLLAMHPIGLHGAFGHNFWEAGKMSARAVRDLAEWWRVTTALTLHADLPHVVGNVVFGAGFGLLSAHSIGPGLAWLGFVISGTLGNYLNAFVSGRDHVSIGASTGVFGVLGLLAAYEWMRRHSLRYPPMRRFAPLLGGLGLLGFLGVGSPESNTDVMAHVTGLVVGVLLGALFAKTSWPDKLTPKGQWIAGLVALSILTVAWWAGLSAA